MQRQQEKPMSKSKKYRVFGPVATVFDSSNTGSWRLERPEIDYSQCIKCGTCERVCPANLIEVLKEEKECVVIDFDYCKGCGVCANECPKKCIDMVLEKGGEK